jgi:integrase/recombinase XerD
MINPVPQGFVGSNPTSSIESSVRCPKTENLILGIQHQAIDSKYEMRDLYNRKVRLERWMQRIHIELQDNEPDKQDILKFVDYLQEKDKSILWIIRCITALLQLRKEIGKPFSQVTKEDMKKLFEWMKNKEYKASTHEKYRVILKIFYKVVYGNNDEYPQCVKWFSVSIGKEIKNNEKMIDIEEYLEEEEILKLIESAPTLQKKAFLAVFYESGCRPEEGLRLTNRDVLFDTNGAILILRGKTGERRVRIVSFAKLLQQWIKIHPLKDKFLTILKSTSESDSPFSLN